MRHTRLTAVLVGVGTAATLLLPMSGASADPGRHRDGSPRVRVEIRQRSDRHERRVERRDAYRQGSKAGRRDSRRDHHRRDRRHRDCGYRACRR